MADASERPIWTNEDRYPNGFGGAANDHGARDDTASAVLTLFVHELRGYIDSLPDGERIDSTEVIISLTGLLNLAHHAAGPETPHL